MSELDLSSFEKALESLANVLQQPLNQYIRDASIQRFEYTFEISWKTLQRFLKLQGVETGSPKQVFRAAFKAKLIDAVEPWFGFLDARNLTTHTYNENTADEVYRAAGKFLPYVQELYKQLKKNED